MDSIDQAQEREEQMRAEAMAKAVKPGNAPSAWSCEDCLEAIPPARRLAVPGCTRCVSCQQMAETGRARR